MKIGAGALALLLWSTVSAPDPFAWLEDGDAPAVQHWTQAQTARTRAYLDALPGRAALGDRFRALYGIGSLGVPSRDRMHTAGGCSTRAATANRISRSSTSATACGGKDRALVDRMRWPRTAPWPSTGGSPAATASCSPTACRANGSEQSTLHVRDVATGKDLPDTIERTRACSLAWLPDGKGFYYTRYPPPAASQGRGELRPPRLLAHARRRPREGRAGLRRGPRQGGLAERRPVARRPLVGRHRGAGLGQGGGLLQGPAQAEDGASCRSSRRSRRSSTSVVRNDRFYVHTNDGGAALPLYGVDPLEAGPADWKEIIPERRRTCSKASRRSATRSSRQYMHKASSRLRLFDATAGKLRRGQTADARHASPALGGEWDGDEILLRLPVVHSAEERLSGGPRGTHVAELWEQVQARHRLLRLRGRAGHVPVEGRDADHDVPGHKKGFSGRQATRRCCTATAASTSA